ncbi:MAG: helix-turn-helix transcriptional regulator [Lachnospiraceae bacterium]|nr:helix-turn-helix transcriptional regulator [Lachnospiraceae bacterium]
MNERLKYLRKELLHLTLKDFGDRIGVSHSAISNIENGARGVTGQMLTSICREFGVREEWLRTGEGEPFGAQTRNQKVQAFANRVMAEEDDSFKKRLVDALSELDESEWALLEQIALRSVKRD